MSNHAATMRAHRDNDRTRRSDFHKGPYAHRLETLLGIMSYPMDRVVARYAAEQGIPLALAREHERELKRYLTLVALNPAHDYVMSGPVDDLWHTFILYTRQYARFCDEHAGHFLHHTPEREPDAEADDAIADALEWYGVFLHEYSAAFGESPPPHVWPDLRRYPVGAATAR